MARRVKIPVVIRDPIHDLIRIECPFAVEVINSQPMQRLRRVKHLGLAHLVYPGAEHSRFSHSLGVFHLAQLAMETMNQNMRALGKEGGFSETQKTLVRLTALLHDVGHGPFSHMFERVAKDCLGKTAFNHERWTEKIILEHPVVSDILNRASDELYEGKSITEDIRKILNGIYKPDYVVDLLSSQMDVDRFDYLLRDSFFAGCHYGELDYQWIFRCMVLASPPGRGQIQSQNTENTEATPANRILAVDNLKGRNCIEEYILGRHFMYIHLYYHKTIVAAERMLHSILKRAVYLIKQSQKALMEMETTGKAVDENSIVLHPDDYPVLKSFAKGENPPLEEYLSVDDLVVMSWVNAWSRLGERDHILSDLSRRLLDRNIFAKIEGPQERKAYREGYESLKKTLVSKGFDPEYYLLEVELSDIAHKDYMFYFSRGNAENYRDIHLWDSRSDKVLPLGGMKDQSVVIRGSAALKYDLEAWCVPKEIQSLRGAEQE